MDYKKTYKPLLQIGLTGVLLLLLCGLVVHLNGVETIYFSKITFIILALCFIQVGRVIEKKEAIYYFVGYEYDDLRTMSPRRRKNLAKRIARSLLLSYGIYIFFMVLSTYFKWHTGLDLIGFFLSMILCVLLDGSLTHI